MTRRTVLVGVMASIAAAVLWAGSGPAVAGDKSFGTTLPAPEDLEVSGGEDRWHPDNGFRLDWVLPDPIWTTPIAAVHVRVRGATGAEVVSDTRIGWAATAVEGVRVPAPGTYTAEVWLESSSGETGAPAAAKLRFDNVRPGEVKPLVAGRWIGRAALPYLIRLTHPAEPLPQSGIRGYALSVDRSSVAGPCAAADRCAEAEIDLRGGVAEDTVTAAELPEGTSYVHAVAVSGAGIKSGVTGAAVVHVDTTDPVTTLSGVPGGWANHPVTLQATATDVLSGMHQAGAEGPFTAIRIDGGTPIAAAGDAAAAVVISEGAHTIAYYARDDAGNLNDGAPGNRPPSTATVRIDRAPPAASFVSARHADEPELIEVRLSDALSGPDFSKGLIAVRRNGSEESFEPLPTGSSGGRLQARWNSDAYPAGEYEFRATGYDVAGNSITTTRRADGADMVLPNPLKLPTAMRAGLGGRTPARDRCERRGNRGDCRREVAGARGGWSSARVVPYGKTVFFSGRLTVDPPAPLAQMPVQVTERFAHGAGRADRVTTVQTGSDGIFVARLEPGPSRQVFATFGGSPTLTRSSAAPVKLGVRADVRMRTSTAVATVGGRPIVFSGRVETGGAEVPAEGKTIQLQFRLPGLPWTEFRTIQTDGAGRFRYAYRFADDDSRGVRFEFRAFAPAQSGWPYEPAGSRPVAVTGREL